MHKPPPTRDATRARVLRCEPGRPLPEDGPDVVTPLEAPPATDDQRRPRTVCVLGAGNAAHVVAALASALPGWRCRVFAPRKDRADLWNAGLAEGPLRCDFDQAYATTFGTPERVSKDAADVVPGADVLLLCVPAHANEEVLRAVAPHAGPGVCIGSVGGGSGIDWLVDEVMAGVGRTPESYAVFSLVNLPWVCRVQTYARVVRVKAVKPEMPLAVRPRARFGEVAALLNALTRRVCPEAQGGFLEVALANICQVIHPFILYDVFARVQPVRATLPLFYQGLSPRGAELIDAASTELLAVRDAWQRLLPEQDFSAVRHTADWLDWAYADAIGDRGTLRDRFRTNRAYAGLSCPGVHTAQGWRVDATHRYLAEDVPCNLVALRGLAQLAGVPTPTVDTVLRWAEVQLGRSFFEGEELGGDDLGTTLAPQRFGLTLDEVRARAAWRDDPGARRGGVAACALDSHPTPMQQKGAA